MFKLPHDLVSIPGWGRYPREGNGNPLQYCCLENSMDGGTWWATVHGVAKSWTRLSDFTFTKGTFHAKMGSIKDRKDMDLTEAGDIKKRWQEYTELYRKDLKDPDNHDSVITHLEPDIMVTRVIKTIFV